MFLLTSSQEYSTDNSSSSSRSFEEWTETNSSLFPFLERLQMKSKLSFSQFQNRRKGIHNRCIDDLLVYKGKIENKIKRLQDLIATTQSLHFSAIGAVVYDSKEQNMDVRKYCFVRREIQEKEIVLYSKQYLVFEQILQKCQSFLDLYSSNLVPPNEIHRIKSTFFSLQEKNTFPKEEKELLALRTHLIKLRSKLLSYEQPLWKTNFSQFLFKISQKGLSQSDPDISYFRPIEEEVALSRALFHVKSNYSETFDKYFEENFNKVSAEQFTNGLVEICKKFIPRSIKNDLQKSAAILQLYRASFNRLYELYPSSFISSDLQSVLKIDNMKTNDFTSFTVSRDLIGSEPHGIISTFFASDPLYNRAADCLSLALFQSNPMDALYCIHMSLGWIQRAALIHRSEHEENNKKNIEHNNSSIPHLKRYLLCFDDLFSLLYGSLMATEYQDIFFVSRFINDFIPKNSLSPGFEYALANIEALSLHCKRVISNT